MDEYSIWSDIVSLWQKFCRVVFNGYTAVLSLTMITVFLVGLLAIPEISWKAFYFPLIVFGVWFAMKGFGMDLIRIGKGDEDRAQNFRAALMVFGGAVFVFIGVLVWVRGTRTIPFELQFLFQYGLLFFPWYFLYRKHLVRNHLERTALLAERWAGEPYGDWDYREKGGKK
jgi:hypothetical protein